MEPEHRMTFGPFHLETLLRQLPLLDVGQADGCFRQALDVPIASRRWRWSGALRCASAGSDRGKGRAQRPDSCWRSATAGSLRALTRPICRQPGGRWKSELNSPHHTEAAKKIQHDQADLLRFLFHSQKHACRDSGWTFMHGAIFSNDHRCFPAWPACGLLVFYDKVYCYMPQAELVILHAVTEFFAQRGDELDALVYSGRQVERLGV